MTWLRQSTARTLVVGPFLDSTDGATAETALTISQGDIRLSKNGGAFAQSNNDAGATHMANGYYSVPLDTTDTGTLGMLKLAVAESGALPVWMDLMVVPANVWDSLFGSDYLQVDAVQVEGSDATDQIRDAVVDDQTRIDASGLNTLSGHDPGETIMGATDLGTGTGLTAVPWNAAWDAEVQSECADALNAYDPPTNAELTSGLSGLNDLDAAGVRTAVGMASANLDTQLGDLPTNSELATALAGADDAVLAAIPSAATVASQVRTELTTELARIDAAITTRLAAAGYTAPDNAGIADIPTNSELASALAAADDAVLSAIAALNDFDPAADTVAHVTLVDTTTTNTDMVSAAPTAAGVADAVWDEALAGHAAAGSAGEALAGADAPSASDNATAVWSAGTRTLTSAGSGGATAQEVWEYATRGLTDKAGFALTAAYEAAKTAASPSDVASALGTYDAPTKAELDSGLAALNDVSTAEVNAACDSAIADAALATAADLATVDGVADSIKTKTDNLPTDPADQSLIEAAIAGISIPAPTVDFTEVLAAIAAIGESGVEVDMSGVLDALAVLQASLGAANITVTAPVAASGTVTLYQGDDYDAAHGRGVAFAVADDVHALGLDAVGAVVSFKCAQATWTGTATETEAGYTLVFEPTAAQTGALTMRRQGYEVEAVLADGDVVTLATGTLAVERDVPSVG